MELAPQLIVEKVELAVADHTVSHAVDVEDVALEKKPNET